MIVNLAVAEQPEQPFYFVVRNRPAQSDAVDVADRNENSRFVGHDAEVIEAAGRAKNGLLLDTGDDAQTVIRVDNLIADFKCHGSPCWKRGTVGLESCQQSSKYSRRTQPTQRKTPEKWAVFAI